MNNYRVTYAHDFKPDYWNRNQAESGQNFRDCTKFYPSVAGIFRLLQQYGIKRMWFFYEPYVEITWLDQSGKHFDDIERDIKMFLEAAGIKDPKFSTPYDGAFGDWYCESELEREFGAIRHSICALFVMNYYVYKEDVDTGKGLNKQIERTIHTICNPLGLNYKDEAKICLSRGLICLLFCFFSFHKAVWIYTKIFRQKY